MSLTSLEASGDDYQATFDESPHHGLEDLTALRRRLEGPSTVGQLLAHASAEACRCCGFERSIVLSVKDRMLTADASEALTDPASDALRRQVLAQPISVTPGSEEGELIRRGAALKRGGGAAHPSVVRDALSLQQAVLAPVVAGSRVVALLVLDRSGPAVGEPEWEAVEIFAHFLGAALERRVLLARMHELSKELRYLTTSAHALLQEAVEAPIDLPTDYGQGAVFSLTMVGEPPSENVHDRFTAREREIVELLASGRSTGEIAEQLHLSPETVKSYVSRLLRKLGASNRVELVARYLKLTQAPPS